MGAVGRLHGSDEDIRLGPLGRRAGGLDRSPDRVRELLLEHEQVERETGRAGDGFEPTQRVVRAPRRRRILERRRRRGGALARGRRRRRRRGSGHGLDPGAADGVEDLGDERRVEFRCEERREDGRSVSREVFFATAARLGQRGNSRPLRAGPNAAAAPVAVELERRRGRWSRRRVGRVLQDRATPRLEPRTRGARRPVSPSRARRGRVRPARPAPLELLHLARRHGLEHVLGAVHKVAELVVVAGRANGLLLHVVDAPVPLIFEDVAAALAREFVDVERAVLAQHLAKLVGRIVAPRHRSVLQLSNDRDKFVAFYKLARVPGNLKRDCPRTVHDATCCLWARIFVSEAKETPEEEPTRSMPRFVGSFQEWWSGVVVVG